MKALKDLLALPWTIRGPNQVQDDHGNSWWEIRVVELPEFLVAGTSKDDVIREYRSALVAFLESYTDREEEPPVLPEPAIAAWGIGLIPPNPTAVHQLVPLNLTLPMLTMGSLPKTHLEVTS